MSHKATRWGAELRGIKIATKGVLMLLCECHNGKTGQCNPGLEWLLECSGLGERALQLHLRSLEDDGLIEREYQNLGRGKGRHVGQYHLKIGHQIGGKLPQNTTVASDLLPQNNAPAKYCSRKKTSLLPQNIAGDIYKEEPERTGNIYVASDDAPDDLTESFNTIWNAWSSTGRKRSKSKPKCMAALKAKAKRTPLAQIVRGALAYAKQTDGAYHKGLHSWLSDERHLNWQARSPEELRAAFDPEAVALTDWQDAARVYLDTEFWPGRLGPAPHQPGCKAPVGILRTLARRMADANHRLYPAINNTLETAA